MKKLTYKVSLLEPLYARALGGEPNSGISLPYIPGALVRSALLLKYRNNFDAGMDDDLRRRFFDGSTRFCNAFPVTDGQPAAPTPRSWQQEKDEHDGGYDFLPGEPGWKITSQCRAVKRPFFTGNRNAITFVSPERVLAVHNRRHRDFGRPVEPEILAGSEDDPGMIFRYEALAPQQVFQGEIVGGEDDLKLIAGLLNDEIHLGGSRSGGYGHARIERVGEIVDAIAELPAGPKYAITFLSNALLRDENGQYSMTLETILKHLQDKLGSGLTLTGEKAFLGQTIVGGFNRKWGLPLPQCVAVAMGSTLRIKIENRTAETENKLKALLLQGIGERRAEGFGRLRIDAVDPSKARLQVENMNGLPDKVKTPVQVMPGSAAETVAKQMLERIFCNSMEAKLLSLTPKVSVDSGNLSGSQLARLRNVVQKQLAAGQPDLNEIVNFIDKMKKRQAVRSKFENVRIEGQRIFEWLDESLKKQAKGTWENLFDCQGVRLTSLGNFHYDSAADEPLRTEFLLRYIDLTLAKLAKTVRQKETGGANADSTLAE